VSANDQTLPPDGNATLADAPTAKRTEEQAARSDGDEAAQVTIDESGQTLRDGGASAANDDMLMGQLINERFRISGVLGEGAMGKVYRAEQIGLERDVALKVIHGGLIGDDDRRARFEREALVLSKIEHPGIVAIYDYGRWQQQTYIAMQLLEGESLETRLRREGAPPLAEAVRIVGEICDALDAAHAAGIIHRDLKPDNVMLAGPERQVKLVDFGVAKLVDSAVKLTQEGMAVGTPTYMAPEQCTGEAVSPQTDLYALGVMIYELLTGKLPFDAPTVQGLFLKHMLHDAAPPSSVAPQLHAAFDEVTLGTLRKNPELRPGSAGELKALLLDAVAQAEGRVSDGHRRKGEHFAADRAHRSQAIREVVGDARSAKPAAGALVVIGDGDEPSGESPTTHLELAGYAIRRAATLEGLDLGDARAVVVDLGEDAAAGLSALEPKLAAGRLNDRPVVVVGPDAAIEQMSRALELELAAYVPRSKLQKRLAKTIRRAIKRA
jgi:predicted Ser/Thr protein kinase